MIVNSCGRVNTRLMTNRVIVNTVFLLINKWRFHMKQLNGVSETLKANFERCDKFLKILIAIKTSDTPDAGDVNSIHNECEQIYRELSEILFFLNGIWNCKTLDEILIKIKANKEEEQ